MSKNAIESAASLAIDADTTHEGAREWYSSYGWHMSTKNAGDVMLQECEYDWLDANDDTVIAKLILRNDELSREESESIVERARDVRDSAESICGLLDEAVTAYAAGDLETCRAALLAAYNRESDHGDSPASQTLAGELLVDAD